MKILVVVDMQNDFISGALGSEEAKKIVPNVLQKIKCFVGMIAATYDNHHENYLETQEGKNLPVIHCVEGEEGWKIADPIREALSNRVNTDSELEVFFKPTFGSVELADWLTQIDRKEKIDEVVLAKRIVHLF